MTDYSYIPIESLVARLDGVKRTAANKWVAKSPTRNERTASLGIRLTDDGRILLHDFGGSSFYEICAALVIHPIQLIPPYLRKDQRAHTPAERQGHDAQAALNGIYSAVIVTRICANKMLDGLVLDLPDHHALRKAGHDIDKAYKAVRGVRYG